MKKVVLITGAGGFLGARVSGLLFFPAPHLSRMRMRMLTHAFFSSCWKLASAISEDRELSDVQLILVDVIEPKAPPNLSAITIQADLTDPTQANALFDTKYGLYDAVYCMHGIMSRGSEDSFDLGIKVSCPLNTAARPGGRLTYQYHAPG